jgi:hypothetical protein
MGKEEVLVTSLFEVVVAHVVALADVTKDAMELQDLGENGVVGCEVNAPTKPPTIATDEEADVHVDGRDPGVAGVDDEGDTSGTAGKGRRVEYSSCEQTFEQPLSKTQQL